MTGAVNLSRPFKKSSSRMKRKPIRLPPTCCTSLPAASAEPPDESELVVFLYTRPDGKTPTRCDDIVHHQHVLALLDAVLLHLEEILPVLLDVRGLLAGAGKLARLADRSKAGADSEGQAGAEEEAPGVETDNHIGLEAEVQDLQLEGADQRGVGGVVGEEREDIDEDYAWLGEVVVASQRGVQRPLRTGD